MLAGMSEAGAGVTVTGLDHIVLWSADVERSLAFYCGVLGCPGERVDAWRQGEVFFPSVRLSATTLIDVFPGGAEGAGEAQPRNLHHFCLVVDAADMAALAARMRELGVPVEEDAVTRWGARGDGTSIYVRDPDGNTVELKAYPPGA
jgi:catechol 2,3-dioxygenase-like lactoylglutathione lyase family enzyme